MSDSYKNFVSSLQENIHTQLKIPLDDIRFYPQDHVNFPNGDRLVVVIAHHEDAKEACGLYTQDIYKSYENGASMNEIIDEISEDFQRILSSSIYEETLHIKNYGKVKEKLFIKPMNANKFSARLENAIYRQIGDIALVLYARISNNPHEMVSTLVQRNIFEKWHLRKEFVFEEAMKNTYRLMPPRLYKWENMIFDPDYAGEDFMVPDTSNVISNSMMGNCISTTVKTNGAIAIFLQGVAQHIASQMNSNFYIAFTSVHEAMVHNAERISPKDLQSVLTDTIDESTPAADFLSSKIYYYSKEDDKFTCVLE